MAFTFSSAQTAFFNKTKGIDIVGKAGIESSSTQFNEALTDGSFVVMNSKTYTGTGAGITLDVSKYLHLITTSASNETVIVPDGTYVGQHIMMILETDGGGEVTFSLANQIGASVSALNDAGENATLVWTGSKWCKVAGRLIV
jgi:hypothetical protein